MVKSSAYDKWKELDKKIDHTGLDDLMINVYHNHFLDIFFISDPLENLQIAIHFNNKLENAIKIDLNGIEGSTKIFKPIDSINPSTIIANKNRENNNLFKAFSATLFDNLEGSETELSCYNNIIKTIKQYRDYFDGVKKRTMSLFEQQGLYGELNYIYENVLEGNGEIIKNWEGPNKNKQDFVFEDNNVEIKTTRNQTRLNIKISNEIQLDNTIVDKLFLKVYQLEKLEVGDSIFDMYQKILPFLTIDNVNLFASKLLQMGMDIEGKTIYEKFNIVKTYYYLVDDQFPKITRASLGERVYQVQYRIDLNGIEEYEQ